MNMVMNSNATDDSNRQQMDMCTRRMLFQLESEDDLSGAPNGTLHTNRCINSLWNQM